MRLTWWLSFAVLLSACDVHSSIGEGPGDAGGGQGGGAAGGAAGGTAGGGTAGGTAGGVAGGSAGGSAGGVGGGSAGGAAGGVGGGSAGGTSGGAAGGSGGGGVAFDGGRNDAGMRLCQTQCDCPGGTICSISGVCEGSACSTGCGGNTFCPCGRACVDGVCDFPEGSLTSCTQNCECPRNELCINNRCIIQTCGHGGGDCRGDLECSACGKLCEPYANYCTTRGTGCFCDGTCAAWGLDGQLCNHNNCVTPNGSLVDLPGGTFGPMSTLGVRAFSTSAITSAGGSTTRITVVADVQVDIHDNFQAALTAPDGTHPPVSLSWQCSGGSPTRFRSSLAVGGSGSTLRAGQWRLDLTDYVTSSSTPGTVGHVWLFLE